MKRTSLLAAGSIAAMLATAAQAPVIAQAPSASVVLGFNSGYSLFYPDGTVQDGLEPPDTNGAVGDTQYGVFINGGYAVYSKADGSLQGSLGTDQSFWQAAGLGGNPDVAAANLSDTRLVYDASTSHWFASEITTPTTATMPTNTNSNQFLVAVSKDSNLLDGFQGFAYNANPDGSTLNLFADYDTLGVNNAGVYLGANMFNAAGSGVGTDQLAISKADLIAASAAAPGGAVTPGSSLFYNTAPNSDGFTAHPVVDLDNGGTAANAGEYLISAFNSTRASVNVLGGAMGVTGTGGATLTANGGNVTVTSYRSVVGAPQLGSTVLIAAGDTRISGAPVKLNGVIYDTQTVRSAAGIDSIRLLGVKVNTDGSFTKVLDQLISSPTTSYYYPSLAINAAGQIVIGFSASSSTQYASAEAIVGQLNTAGTAVTFGSPLVLQAGLSSYGYSRWGDYSATFIDPSDPTKFWTTQEFANTTPAGASGNWSTYVAELSLAAAPEPSQFAAFGIGLLGLGALTLRARKRQTA